MRHFLPLLTLACALLAACGDDNPGETRVLVIDESPELVDPAREEPDEGDAVLMGALAQGLVRFDARGQIVPGLAERWHVSDDGRSYIFRLAAGEWPGGDPIRARGVAEVLDRLVKARRQPLRGALNGVEDVVAMTDRVIEIRLSRPQSDLLTLLAQPELAIMSRGKGSGPFMLADHADDEDGSGFHLTRLVSDRLRETSSEEVVHLNAAPAQTAIGQFAEGAVSLVLGGRFHDLPYAQNAQLPGGSLRFDPVLGLFGLVPVRRSAALDDVAVRGILDRAIDREALVADLGVPGLTPRATLLQAGLEGIDQMAAPAWTEIPVTQRQEVLATELARRLDAPDGDGGPILRIRVFLPEGPGADLLFNRLAADWGRIGVEATRAESRDTADYALVDAAAPSTAIEWFLSPFRCGRAVICSEEAELLFEQAGEASTIDQRRQALVEAAAEMDRAEIFIPLTAPVRWSLVGPYVTGFAPNRLGRHPLTGLKTPLAPETRQ